ncbi:putative membrane protein YdjX (TVP38/TMEM64 family) [Alkalibacillus flavidus]|uniref:TVP38/TMEM64 family membrane protein n=1 Tax=Alkalibacillus flavidus TaxID=546021 RepID=A0ABV2KVF9_9BACI
MKRVSLWKITIVAIVVVSLLWLNYNVINVSPREIRAVIYETGWLAPVVYLLLYSVRSLVLFPASVFSIVGGLAFGVVFGSVLALAGATLSAIVAFFAAKKFGERAIQLKQRDKVEQYRQRFEERGFTYILMLRLVPVINFDFISYTAGLAKVYSWDFVKATVIGIIPGTIVYSFVGSSIVDGEATTLFVAGTVLALMIVIPLVWKQQLTHMIERMKTNG